MRNKKTARFRLFAAGFVLAFSAAAVAASALAQPAAPGVPGASSLVAGSAAQGQNDQPNSASAASNANGSNNAAASEAAPSTAPSQPPAASPPAAAPAKADNALPPPALPAVAGDGVPDFFSDGPADALSGAQSALPGAAPAPKTQAEVKEEVRGEAYDAALDGLLPLRPDEIRQLLERFDRTKEASELPAYPAPKPEVAVETISLDPGAKPSAIKTAYGTVTTLSMLDITGSPWAIQDVSWAGNFEVVESSDGGEGGHIIRISPQSEFATGNISIRLIKLKTPVILSLETSRDTVHYRFDAIVPDYGPMAQTPLIEGGISTKAGSPELASALQGIMPKSAKKLSVSGVDGRTTAYSLDGQTYLRTPLTLLSPSWNNSVTSADGMKVYTIKDASVVLLSDRGKMMRAYLSPNEDIFNER